MSAAQRESQSHNIVFHHGFYFWNRRGRLGGGEERDLSCFLFFPFSFTHRVALFVFNILHNVGVFCVRNYAYWLLHSPTISKWEQCYRLNVSHTFLRDQEVNLIQKEYFQWPISSMTVAERNSSSIHLRLSLNTKKNQ